MVNTESNVALWDLLVLDADDPLVQDRCRVPNLGRVVSIDLIALVQRVPPLYITRVGPSFRDLRGSKVEFAVENWGVVNKGDLDSPRRDLSHNGGRPTLNLQGRIDLQSVDERARDEVSAPFLFDLFLFLSEG